MITDQPSSVQRARCQRKVGCYFKLIRSLPTTRDQVSLDPNGEPLLLPLLPVHPLDADQWEGSLTNRHKGRWGGRCQ
jgi:hypothetical protein